MPLYQPFVFDGDNFVQADTVYLTDMAVFFNRTEKRLFLWAGKRVSRATIDAALQVWEKFTEKYADFNAINLISNKEQTDFELAREIRVLLAQHVEAETAEKTKNIYAKVSQISCIIAGLCLVCVFFNEIYNFLLPIAGTSLVISNVAFATFFNNSLVILGVGGIFFIIAFISAFLGKNSHIAVPSLLAVILCAGFWIFLSQRDFLFYILNYGINPDILEISVGDIYTFSVIHAIIFAGVSLLFLIASRVKPKTQTSDKIQTPSIMTEKKSS
ncbi:MAG: hypothetical protein RBG13Loki_1768 [Promethearchaeota archaeon CR_4]|nr:MAG: hypothetical protein RBG13Loki_1768 [Candidatus Lokiarchaeota archaeon CR_4]